MRNELNKMASDVKDAMHRKVCPPLRSSLQRTLVRATSASLMVAYSHHPFESARHEVQLVIRCTQQSGAWANPRRYFRGHWRGTTP
jgi:hypothetical protein